jgi:hypothetical protein
MQITIDRRHVNAGHDAVTFIEPSGLSKPCINIRPEVPADVLDKAVAFCCHGAKDWYDVRRAAERVGKIFEETYGTTFSEVFHDGNRMRHNPLGRKKTDRQELAEYLAEYLGRDVRDLDTTPDWVLSWAEFEVRQRVEFEQDGCDIFERELSIDLHGIWKRVAREVEARLEACGMTPPVTPEEVEEVAAV